MLLWNYHCTEHAQYGISTVFSSCIIGNSELTQGRSHSRTVAGSENFSVEIPATGKGSSNIRSPGYGHAHYHLEGDLWDGSSCCFLAPQSLTSHNYITFLISGHKQGTG